MLLARLRAAARRSTNSSATCAARGLLIGLDLVRDRATKEQLSAGVSEMIFKEALKRGLLMMGYFPRVRINPPLVITEEQAEAGVAILEEVFAHVRDHCDWREA